MLDTLPAVDQRLRLLVAARDKVIATSSPQLQPRLTRQWWEQVDELLETRLRIEQDG